MGGARCGAILHNIGVTHLSLGRYDQALHAFEQALFMRQAGSDKRALAQTMTSIGETKNLLGKTADLLMFIDALKLWREAGDVRGEAATLTGLGVALYQERKLSDALSHLDSAALKHMEAGNAEGQAHTFHHLMMAWRDKGNRPLAIYYGKLAVDGYQDIRRNIVDLDSQLQNTYIKSKEETYRVLAGLLIEEGRLLEKAVGRKYK